MKKIHWWYSVVLCLVLVASLCAEVKSEPYKTGVRKLTPEEKAELEPRIFRITKPRGLFKAPLPACVKNTTYLPVVTSQGSLGSCAAYATCYYYKTYQEAREHGWIHPDPSIDPEHIASPAWGYDVAPRISLPDGAVSHWKVADYICEYGIASWKEMPYSDSMDLTAWPTEEIWRRGIEWRGRQVGAIDIKTSEGLEALKEHLASGDIAVVAIPAPPNLFSYPNGDYIDNDVLYANAGGPIGGHALTVIGYDDNRQYYDAIEGVTKKGAFLLVNSWGQNWGVTEPAIGTRGFIWIAYDYFLKYNNFDPDALIMVDRINYKPNLFAIIGINHTKGRNLIVKIKNGVKESDFGITNTRWEKSGLPFSNGYPLTGQRIVVDLSDYAHYDNFVYYLEVRNLKQFGGEGEITYFAVQRGDSQPVESHDAPKTIVQNWYIWLQAGLFDDAGIFNDLKIRRGSIVWADFNADSKPDFIATGNNWINGSPVPSTLLYINQGNSRFSSGISAGLPQLSNSLLAAGDYNNDGFPDLILHGYNQSTQKNQTAIYRNNRNGTFTDIHAELPQEIISLALVDYDNDGRLDAAISTETQILLYKNQGSDTFSLIAPALNASGSMAWADYDNDGWVDVAVCGANKSVIFRNLGDGIFSEINVNLPALAQSSIAWGDFDADGYLDLAITGRVPHTGEGITAVFRNNGDSTFTDINLPINGLWAGSIAWADVDNNGYLDLLVTGRDYDAYGSNAYGLYSNHTRIYTNDGHGWFSDAIAGLPDVSCSADISFDKLFTNTLAAVDFDSDGDLDLFLSGTMTYIFATSPEMIYTGIQKSLVANEEGFNRPNSLPSAPGALSVQAGWENGAVILSWSPGSDSETPQNGLCYNVRVGTYPGGNNIISGANTLIVPGGIPYSARKLLLTGLAPGTYYWAVQTIDAGRAVSAWSEESSFVVPSYTRTYRLHISSASTNQGTTNPVPGVYEYAEGTAIQITAVPYPGYVFSHWSGDVENPNQNPAIVTMNRPRLITANFSLQYNLSPAWTQSASSSAWSSRTGHASVVFNGKIWILGGSSPAGITNDIWYSTDGTNWTQALTEAPWTKRYYHICLVFNGKIWVMGGYGTSSYLNDVWSSTDGINWTQEISNAPWSGRYSATGLVYNGKMWIMGGKGATGWLNDVWYSTDGKNWVRATGSANWFPREGAAGVVFDGKMWIIGGQPSPAQKPDSDVWYSIDGITWTMAVSSANWRPRYRHTALVLDNRIWILGGMVRDIDGSWITPVSEVWYSWDGVHWTLVPDAVPWQARYSHGAVVFNNRLWVIGGSTTNGSSNDVWSGLPPGLPSGVLILTMAANPVSGGTTIPEPGCHYAGSGAVFSISASPNPGYRFVNWSGDVADSGSISTSVTLNTSKTITANFEKIPTHTLTISVSPSTVGITIPAIGSYTFPEGTVVDLTAIPSYRYVFSNWTGGVADPNSFITTVTMDADKTITANFIPDPFAPAVGISGGANHTVFLQSEGTVWTWGCNGQGQLGDGTFVSSEIPISFAVLENSKAVSAGAYHTAALKEDGTVWTWGSNQYGQLGTGSFISNSNQPVIVPGLTGIIAIDCGGFHTVALREDRTVWTWGQNESGQLGIGADAVRIPSHSPCQVLGVNGAGYLTGIKEISAGFSHTLALSEHGTLVAWGNNAWGQLGTGTHTSSAVPLPVNSLTGIRAISAGGGISGSHSLAVKDDGSVWAWGCNSSGQLGDGTTADRLLPTRVCGESGVGYLSGIISVAAGMRHSLALADDGTVWAWGDNTYGQLGDGSYENRVYPVKVSVVSNIVMISAGALHSIAVDNQGRVWVWGHNICGELGNGTRINSSIPVCLSELNVNNNSVILTVAVNPSGSGTTVPSGSRYYRQGTTADIIATATKRYQFSNWSGDATGNETRISVLMDRNKNITANFQLVPGIKCKLTMISSPEGAGFLIPSAGVHEYEVGSVVNITAISGYRYRFTRWSENVFSPYQAETSVTLNGDTDVTAYFESIPFSTKGMISAGGQNALVLKEDSTVWASGANNEGQLGIGTISNDSVNWPVQVLGENGAGFLTGIISISGGGSYYCAALGYDGSVFTWGRNYYGQLGDGTLTRRTTPVRVKSPDGAGTFYGIVGVSAGGSHTVAVRLDGTVWAWGRNNYGQLGDNTTVESRLLPVQVKSEMAHGYLTNVSAVAAGAEHTLALMKDGTVKAWGNNSYGQLGNATSGSISAVPVSVSNLTNVIAIAANNSNPYDPFSMALLGNGTVWTWGRNRYGQLGNGVKGENSFSSVPVQVSGLTDVKAIAAGGAHALALKNDGTVWAWGYNGNGQLGDGTNEDRTTPVQVKGPNGEGFLTGVIAISAGYRYSMALKNDGTVWFWGYNEYNIFGDLRYHQAPTGHLYPVQRNALPLDTSAQLVYLIMQVYPAGAGTTVPVVSIHAYNPGTLVNLRAEEAMGYQFSHWSEGPVNRFVKDTTIVMDTSKTVTAYFESLNSVPGDINRDNVIDITDVILCLRMCLELPITIGTKSEKSPYPNDRINLADMDSSGIIDISDVILILRFALGLGGSTAEDRFAPRPVVPPETSHESVSVDVNAGQTGTASLSDGTGVFIPAIESSYKVLLSRESNIFQLTQLGQETSGSMRTLKLTFDSTLTETDRYKMSPVITIPAREIGVVNPDTVNICRIVETIVDGKVVRNYGFLPVFKDVNGNYVVKDNFLPVDLLNQENLPGAVKGGMAPVYINYVASTFQGNINWQRPAYLIRMVPYWSESERKFDRKPIDKLSKEEKAVEEKKPIKNVIVLVHGHNENEQAGIPGTYEWDSNLAPWYFSYKKDVWTPFYEKFMTEFQQFNSCTVFYEFIYPTWRPIFNHLDDELVKKITEELKKQLGNNDYREVLPFNLFIVAHSMGGVVSRAAAIKFPEVLDEQFKHLVTWGSPHHGSALYSFRYLMANPAYRFRGQSELGLLGPKTALAVRVIRWLSGAYIASLALDTPGIRDLTWTNGPSDNRRCLTFDYFMTYDEVTAPLLYGLNYLDILDLKKSSLLYNLRLQQLNANDRKGDRYTCLYGVTNQGIPDDYFSGSIWDIAASLEDAGRYLTTEIAKGATLNRFLIENGSTNYFNGYQEGRSDGAVPIISGVGLGITSNNLCLGDIDHEEFFNLPGKASVTARTTLEILGFGSDPKCDPPEVEFTCPAENDPLETDENGYTTITGTVTWTGDNQFYRRVKNIKVFIHTVEYDLASKDNWQGIEIPDGEWTIDADGNFSIDCQIPEPEKVYAIKVVFVFKDDTELPAVVMLGSQEEFSTVCQGETIHWSIDGLERVFLLNKEGSNNILFTFAQPGQGATPSVSINAYINPVYQAKDRQYGLFLGAYPREGGFPKDYEETVVIWESDQPEPPAGLSRMEVSFSVSYQPGDFYAITYDVVGYSEFVVDRMIDILLYPWKMREKTDLLPPYFRHLPPPPP